MKRYYEARAREYDDWWLGANLFAEPERPGWAEELTRLLGLIASLPAARTLDVACGTGFLTRHLPGEVVALDQSESMLDLVAQQAPNAIRVHGDAYELPFANAAFDRIFTSHFYGHLEQPGRERFLAEAWRVAHELVVVDAAWREGVEAEEWQERILNDGTRWRVYKRYFEPEVLAEELGGEVLCAGRWFVVTRARRAS